MKCCENLRFRLDKCADAVDDKQDAERNVKTVERNGSGKLQCGAAKPVAECGVFAGVAAFEHGADGMGAPGQLFGGVLDAAVRPARLVFSFWLAVSGVCIRRVVHGLWPALACTAHSQCRVLWLWRRNLPEAADARRAAVALGFFPAWRVLRRGQQGKPVYPVALLCGWGLFCRAVRA